MKEKFNEAAFKEKLEAQTSFPTLYPFKFIVPKKSLAELKALFPNRELVLKDSSKGNYTSVSFQLMVPNSERILEVYRKAASVEGLIAL
ncbi:MAG: DUF493 family protein [Nitritalea sp.]